MPKNIIVCTDGTWNHPAATDLASQDFTPADTNVYKLFSLLAGEAQTRSPTTRIKQVAGQVALYDDGVGADGVWAMRVVEGATGAGLELKLRDGYQFVSEQYEPGDRLYLCGFSRGAFTARSLGGMLTRCGVPSRTSQNNIFASHAFDVYRRNDPAVTAQYRTDYLCQDVTIEVIGVWDTVGALGIPIDLFSALDHLLFRFHDTSLHPNVRFGYHALAIDEQRESFAPALWDAREGIEQVWFAGVHADIGGGYHETGLSDLGLAWMLKKVQAHGILFGDCACRENGVPNITGDPLMTPMHDSYRPPFVTARPAVRAILPSAAIHVSVQQRWAEGRPPYRPGNLPAEPRTYVE
jgi:uncharacterized protein (DUF2235 family)